MLSRVFVFSMSRLFIFSMSCFCYVQHVQGFVSVYKGLIKHFQCFLKEHLKDLSYTRLKGSQNGFILFMVFVFSGSRLFFCSMSRLWYFQHVQSIFFIMCSVWFYSLSARSAFRIVAARMALPCFFCYYFRISTFVDFRIVPSFLLFLGSMLF